MLTEQIRYILGLDLGVGSVGWAAVLINDENEPYRILDLGSRIFASEGNSMEDRRVARGIRRVLRRRRRRVIRTKNLFGRYGYLTKEQIKAIYQTKGEAMPDPYQLRIKGKKERLTLEELAIILIHYAKGRGFKSNRKIQENEASESKSANEEQKLLFAKQQMESRLAEKQKEDATYTFTDLLLEDQKVSKRIRNTNGEYLHGVTRKMIEQEVTMILDKQIEFGLVCEDFKEEYLKILLFQRKFSEGPDEPSPYHNPFEQMIGKCSFTQESRAPKSSLSYELFTLVQKLHDIRFRYPNEKENSSLSVEQIKKLVSLARQSKKITYKTVRDVVGADIYFTGLMLSKKDYQSIVDSLKKDDTLDMKTLIEKKKGEVEIFKLKNFAKLAKNLRDQFGKNFTLSDQQYDMIADCLSRNKSDEEIENYLYNRNKNRLVLNDVELPSEVIEAVLKMDDKDYKEFGKVSFSFLYKVLPSMIEEGLDYTKACNKHFGDHRKQKVNEEDFGLVPVIDEILANLEMTITNKAVIRTLVESRKVVNAVIRKYGKPFEIHVEMARELTKSEDERKEIFNEQLSNQACNDSLKYQIYSQHPAIFGSIEGVKSADLIKYKLFIEQKGLCPYTLLKTGSESEAKINERELFTNLYEVDHIVPYSISFDDRIMNKVLVKRERNQEKGNKLPMESFGGNEGESKYLNWVKNNYNISFEKKDRLMAKKVSDQMLNDYRARTLNDTRYAIKAFKDILVYSFPSVKVRSYTGQVTAKLRGVWQLNGLTHSYESDDYRVKNEISEDVKELYDKLSNMILNHVTRKAKEYVEVERKLKQAIDGEKKNRENHLHHALDAVVIACATDSIRRRVEMQEMTLRQKGEKNLVYYVPEFDEETGEYVKSHIVKKSYEEYRKELEKTQNYERGKLFPVPYVGFVEEVILRTYEMDKEILQYRLSQLPQYQDVDVKDISPLFVSHHYSTKISGRLHKATFYGLKETEEGKVLTERMMITSDKFDKKKLDKIFDVEKTQSYIYSAVKDWLGSYKNGAEAYEKQKRLPINKNGNPIKKVKLVAGELKEEFSVKQNTNQYVEKENVLQIHVYKRKNDEKLYFVGMDRFRLMNLENREDLNLVLWYGQNKSNLNLKKSELKANGFVDKPMVLYKGQIVAIELKNGAKGLAKVGGCASGFFEVHSILGDACDLIEAGFFQEFRKRQYLLTVSTIKSIKPISVDILGKIHSNVL